MRPGTSTVDEQGMDGCHSENFGERALPVLRAEPYSLEHLEAHGRQLGCELALSQAASDAGLFSRFEDNCKLLRSAHATLRAEAGGGEPVAPDVEWLLDNFYVVEEQLREIVDDLPARFYRELPRLGSGQPRVYAVALELLLHRDSALDEEAIARYIAAVQETGPLSMGETWAFPIMLRLGLVENLRRLSEQVLVSRANHYAARRLFGEQSDESLIASLGSPETPAPFFVHLVEQLQAQGADAAERLEKVERWLSDRNGCVEDIVRNEHQRQAANQVSIGNVITSMRLISSLDWIAFFEHANHAEKILRRDPAQVYSQMAPESRDRYRHAVEELAWGAGLTDLVVAECALDLAKQATCDGAHACRQHVGFYLVAAGRERLEQAIGYRPSPGRRLVRAMLSHPHVVLFGGAVCTTLLLVCALFGGILELGGSPTAAGTMALLALVPLSELGVSLTSLLITRIIPPRLLPKLDFADGVPADCATFVVIPALIADVREVDGLLDRLEMHYLANADAALRFALLSDLPNSPTEHEAGDASIIEHAVERVRALNDRYGSDGRRPFHLFHRAWRWNPSEQIWMGWERKRGKLIEFNRLLRGATDTSFTVCEGEFSPATAAATPKIEYVITLDADTQLPHGAARRLIATLSHPLNRPRVAAPGGPVEGYCVLQPRLIVQLTSANRSRYSRLTANSAGIDPYSTCASDVYQDLFGEGSFTGKGIYHVDTFSEAVDDAFPENSILSHDLIEGCYSRVALVSDIELADGIPARYEADAQRHHRWVRGDWQLVPWLFPRVPAFHGRRPNPLSALDRWKVLDNLRRSFVAPALVAWLIAGWSVFPALAWLWTATALVVCCFPLLWDLSNSLASAGRAISARSWNLPSAAGLGHSAAQCLVAVVFLPHRAWLMADAIARTLYRVFLSRRHLLEWETAAATENRLSRRQASRYPTALWIPTILAVALIAFLPSRAALAAAPFLLAWVGAMYVARWLNQPRHSTKVGLSPAQKQSARSMAQSIWSFFEAVVTAKEHWLPPDNLQEYPVERIAHRISPTNEGLFLVSALVARDLGFVPLRGLAELLDRNLATWSSLEQHHGHFFNWYDTLTLKTLSPRYVSTVDSGNLAVALLTVRQGLEEQKASPIVGPDVWRGLCDRLDAIREKTQSAGVRGGSATPPLFRLEPPPQTPETIDEWLQLLRRLNHEAASLEQIATPGPQRGQQAGAMPEVALLGNYLKGLLQDIETFFPWVSYLESTVSREILQILTLNATPEPVRSACSRLCDKLRHCTTLAAIVEAPHGVSSEWDDLRRGADQSQGAGGVDIGVWLDGLQHSIESGAAAAAALVARFERLGAAMETLAQQMDFRFLYNPNRRLFSIGYNLEIGALDRAHYDLLCSEARLASYIAISKRDVEYRHWFQLGRQSWRVGDRATLVSWGGTMFEYLMPALFQRTEPDSLLDESCRAAVARQQNYARQRRVPWGISECAFGAMAANADYYYQSFGVPGLGFKRGLSKDLVISPYSTMLALEFDPQGAFRNLERLAHEGCHGRWGYYEAIDYSPERVPAGQRAVVVKCYMSHHQGMSLVALGNLLCAGSSRRRFHAHPLGRACELLLQERYPDRVSEEAVEADEAIPAQVAVPADIVCRRVQGIDDEAPRTHLLSNGQYSVMLSHLGGSRSLWRDTAVTRWRSDSTRDHWGQFIYLRDLRSGKVWSATYQPTRAMPDNYETIFSIDKADVRRRDGQIETHMEVTISPENNAELRQIKLTNLGDDPIELEITTYAEIVLASEAADVAHPAFQNLFVETEYLPDLGGLLASRRPRGVGPERLWAWQCFAAESGFHENCEFETSRQAFLGRGRSPADPTGLRRPLAKHVGSVLDPVFVLRSRVSISAHGTITLGLATGVAQSREEATMLVDQYHDLRVLRRAFELAWAYQQVELRHWQISPAQSHLFQRLGAALIYPNPAFRGTPDSLRANRQGQAGLWRYGISGDVPLMLAHIDRPEHVSRVQELIDAQQFWRRNGLRVDLAISNDYPGSYFDALHEQLVALVNAANAHASGREIGIFLLRSAQLPPADRALLETAATVVWETRYGSLEQQLARIQARTMQKKLVAPPRFAQAVLKRRPDKRELAPQAAFDLAEVASKPSPPANGAPPREFWNGTGGFADDGRSYQLKLATDGLPPAPWANVIANPSFGCLVTESGGGYTWAVNSREYKLSSWSNDPVVDPPSEALYVCDTDSGKSLFSQHTGGSARASGVEHGAGYSRFTCDDSDVSMEVTIAVARNEPVKFIAARLHNRGSRPRRLSLTYYVEWVLGVCREQTQLHVATAIDSATGALVAANAYHPELPEQRAFLHVLGPTRSCTGDRTEFLGRGGSVANPQAIRAAALSGHTGVGLDPCGAVQSQIVLDRASAVDIVFLLGAAGSEAELRTLLEKYNGPQPVRQEISHATTAWDDLRDDLQIKTPVRSIDLLFNHWLLYQSLSCRIWGRSACYQSGGAYGFRDQLQDVLALVPTRPQIAREHILRAAGRQFEEGDVQHWWHPPSGRGTRTRFSDDYLWLPLAACQYARVSGDATIWDEQVPFLKSPPLPPQEHERYEQPEVSRSRASLYEHCVLAATYAFRLGAHGLPLMGCGDWNDGMNAVGSQGRGESVWVGWFLLVVLEPFLPVMRHRGDSQRAAELTTQAARLREALEREAWDGAWYRRAFFDDGTPLGSAGNEECRIDSIVQSWAVFAKADATRAKRAMQSVRELLVDRSAALIKLFKPPFDKTEKNPGYIKGYPPGIRENGGQYTHAALWTVRAFAHLGDGETAVNLLRLINPIEHSSTTEGIERYRVEPYVVAADVYAGEPHSGRGGWTWYTGSAAWMYRVILEDILGFDLRGNRLRLSPSIPQSWSGFQITYRRDGTLYRIRVVQNPDACRTPQISVDGHWCDGSECDLPPGGEHDIVLHWGGRSPSDEPVPLPERTAKAVSATKMSVPITSP